MHGDKRLLIVDDDPAILLQLKDSFEAEGYQVALFQTPAEALAYVQAHGLPHLALVDLELPDMPGFNFSARLKRMGDVPIIFITGNDDINTIVDGLRRYADDYVVKPFKVAELSARVKRVLSRIADFSFVHAPVITVDDWLSVDFSRSRIVAGGREHLLTRTEVGLLHILMRNSGRVVPAELLLARVWPTQEVYEDTLRVHMHRLRRKLEQDVHHPKYILTERGIGYRFVAASTLTDTAAPSQSL